MDVPCASPPHHHHRTSSPPSLSHSPSSPSSPTHSLQLRPGPLHSLADVSRLRSLLLLDTDAARNQVESRLLAAHVHPHSLLTESIVSSDTVDGGTIVYTLDGHDSILHSPSLSTSPPSKRGSLRHSFKFPLATVTEAPAWEDGQWRGAQGKTMSVEVVAAPGSPPDFGSSKSSSLRSSSTPHADEFNDASHFEDISLTDTIKPDTFTSSPLPLVIPDVKPRKLLRPATTPLQPYHSKSHGNLRDVANSGLKTTAQRSIYQKSSRSSKDPYYLRGNWNKSVPSLNAALTPPGPHGRRTPSPTKTQPGQISPLRSQQRPNSGTRPKSDSAPQLPMLHRKSSWQPQRRKSSRELEAEYDDNDEEVPEDAIIFNVPLSPRPTHSRSQSESPERGTPSPQSGSLQEVRDFRASRTKSWDAMMRDLSKETRVLTSKLEKHSDGAPDDKASAIDDTRDGSPSPPRPTLNTRSKTVGLPPLQRGHAMIDPLPASKEKEKHLSRTRPSWLPPKSPKEERKHLREYQRMMSDFLLAENKRNVRKETEKRSRGKEDDTLAKRWIHSIIPEWDSAIQRQSTRELWWRGIPPSIRGLVWSRAIGNELHLSSRSYEAALARAKAAPGPENGEDAKSRSKRRSITQMQADVAACFPEVNLFQANQPKHEELFDVLSAYASYRSDTGYVRGTASIAALLLLYVTSPADAFIALANLLNRPLSLALCLNDETSTQRVYRSILRVMSQKLPKLHAHILATCSSNSTSSSANPQKTLTYADWFEAPCTSLLTTLLNADACARIWDVMLFEGDGALVRGLIGTLSKIEGRLYADTADVNLLLGYNNISELDIGSAEDVASMARWAGRMDSPAKDEGSTTPTQS